MKRFIDTTLSILSALVATGTGWAVFAGVTKQPVFPVWTPIAYMIGVSIIALDIAIGMLITDIYRFNQAARNKTERETPMPSRPAWFILSGAVMAEIVLSLLIVVFESVSAWGVLVFPPLTIAGVFVTALRSDLQTREILRIEMRKPKPQSEPKANPKTAKRKKADYICRYAGAGCKQKFATQNAANAHARGCVYKPIAIDLNRS